MKNPPPTRDAANAAFPELQHIFDSLLAVVLVLSKKSTIKYVNKAFEHITGFAPAEVIGTSCLSVIDETDHEQTASYFQALIQGKRITHFQARFKKKSGGLVITSWEGRWDPADQAFYFVFRDATERQQLAEMNARHAEELRRKNEEMRETLERIEDGFFSLDHNWKFVYCNQQAEKMIGRPQEQLLSKSYWDCFPTMIGSKEETYYRKAATQQTPVHFEAFYPLPQARWFSISAYPSAKGISVFFRDITVKKTHEEQRNLYEKELERRNLHYQQILDRITDAFFAVDNDWTVTFINEKAEQMLGFSRDEILGRNLWSTLPQTLGTSIEKNFRQAVDLQLPHYFTAPSTISKKLLEFSLYPSPNGLTVYYRDITEKEQKERELCKLSLLAKETEDGVIFLHPSGEITWCNQAFIRMSGYSFEEVIGQTTDVLLKGTDTDKATLNHIMKRFRKGLPAHAEILNYKKSGEPFWVEVSVQPVYDREGRITEFFSIRRDITERKKFQQQLDLQQKKTTLDIIAAQEHVRAQVGQELHDNVNQVLTTIKLYQELGLSGHSDSHALMAKSMQLLQYSIDEIRSLSKRLSAPTLGSIKLKGSVEELLSTVRATHKVRVLLRTSRLEQLEVGKDLHLAIYRILQEHLTNVLRHANASEVKVVLGNRDHELVLLVRDNGKGFDTAAKRSGIGLANMVSRAESLRGIIKVSSTPGKGCLLKVILPLCPQQSKEFLNNPIRK